MEETSLARFQQNTYRNKQIFNLANILRRPKLYLTSKRTTETPTELSLFTMGIFFCKNALKTLTCSIVTIACLVAISGHLSKVNLNQWEQSTVFPTLTLVREILSQGTARRNNCSSFRIQFSISHFHRRQALRFLYRIIHSRNVRVVFLWTRNLYIFLALDPD